MKKPTLPTHGPIVSGQFHEGTDAACTYVRKSIFSDKFRIIGPRAELRHVAQKCVGAGAAEEGSNTRKQTPRRCLKECLDLRAGTDVNGNTYVVMLLIENRNCLKHVMKHTNAKMLDSIMLMYF